MKQWRLEHQDEDRERHRKYWQTDNGKAYIKKHNDDRRNLGSIEINKPFPGSERHHTDEYHIIHIPDELHHSIPHNVFTGQGMEDINKVAMDFLMYEIQEGIILRG